MTSVSNRKVRGDGTVLVSIVAQRAPYPRFPVPSTQTVHIDRIEVQRAVLLALLYGPKPRESPKEREII